MTHLATLAQAHEFRAKNQLTTGAEYVALMARIDYLAKLEGVTK